MIGGLTMYPEYKDSGVRWLGNVPSHWSVRRIRHVAELRVSNIDKNTVKNELPVRLCNYVDVYKNERITVALKFMRATATSEEVERFRLKSGDVLITKDSESWTDIGVPALVECEAEDLVCGYHLAILRPHCGMLDGGFLLRAMQTRGISTQLHFNANGVTRYGLSQGAIKDALLPIPPIAEQAPIIRFLDHANSRIERFIRAKKKIIALLDEQRQAVIQQAVTRGLDPDARFKPSGVSWLGDVPAHWEVSSLRFRYHQCLGKMVDAKKFTGRHLVPYLRNVDVRWDKINVQDLPLIDIEPHERERYTVRVGDLLVCEGRHLGRCAFWNGAISICAFQKALHRLRAYRPDEDSPRFLYYCMRQAAAMDAFNLGKIDNTIPHLTGEMLRAHRFAFPPMHEQEAIASYLDRAVREVDHIVSKISDEISTTAPVSCGLIGRT